MIRLLAQFEDDRLLPAALLIIGIVFISAWLLMRLRRRNLRGPGYPTARENLERYKQKEAIRDDLERLMVDIEQLAKRLGAQLDAKALRVEKLLDDADLRISQLQQNLREQHTQPPAAPAANDNATAHGSPTPPPAPADPLAADVYRLADAGHDPPAIARQLDEHIGKVELILALRKA